MVQKLDAKLLYADNPKKIRLDFDEYPDYFQPEKLEFRMLIESAFSEVLLLSEEKILYVQNRLFLIRNNLLTLIGRIESMFYGDEKHLFEGFTKALGRALIVDIEFNVLNKACQPGHYGGMMRFLQEIAGPILYKVNLINSFTKQLFEITGIDSKVYARQVKVEHNGISGETQVDRGLFISYQWLDDDFATELRELYEQMYSRYINETSVQDFTAAFSGCLMGDFQPVKWKASPSELLYFIRSLTEKGLINSAGKRMDYLKLSRCFVKDDGKPFDVAFKNINQRLDMDLSKAKKSSIDKVLSNFL
ncbi:hypothetical protein M0L20_00075 [Spirosoma sp. RP8]|uniref:Uncharacterized protein n=1 Tax=Spirosoma liriopis TaxID=2937440 RepID=A0ABT0HEE4_9BACT|nr:hypothetical protein [Spirosoma liriopis]MCK8490222.1 hypothetical protein [Spirosoma liriopis]